VKAFLDIKHSQAPAVAMGGQRIELAGAAIGEIAIAELAALDFPIGHDMASFT